MKLLPSICILITILLTLSTAEPPIGKRHLGYPLWIGKSAKQIALNRNKAALAGAKQHTLVVQIRSDQPVPLVLKGGRNAQQQLRHAPNHIRGIRPVKLTGPIYLNAAPGPGHKPLQRKPLKIKLANTKPKHKPATSYEVPFRFEVPTTNSIAYPPLGNEGQQLPSETHHNFITEHEHDNDHFAPIHTIPAPNLSLPENHPQESYLPPKIQSQTHHQTLTIHNNENQYQVTEEHTNDQTIRDPLSGSQKLFAPDPDPLLPAAQLRPVTEPYNQPSNGKPLPVDVQSNFLVPAQPLVQIIGAQDVATPEIYPIQFTQQAQLQPLVSANVAAVHTASAPIYDPTYLVTQSNQLYTQHQQQLFQPSANLVQAYVNADLTQEIASDGQILQAAKDPHHNIHPVLDSAPQFAALIAAPVLGEQSAGHYNLQPQAAALTATSAAPEGGFVVSNYYDNADPDNSQLLQAYAEEEAQRLENEVEQDKQQHLLALQQQQQQQEVQQQELQQQQQIHLQLQEQQLHQQLQEQQLHQQLQEQQLHQQLQEQQLHQQLQEQQLQQHLKQQQQQQQQQQLGRNQQQSYDPSAAAFQEHQRLVQQQLGADTPLRIFVPDDEAAGEARLQKRSNMVKKGTVEDASTANDNTTADDDLFEVSSSVEVSNENQKGTMTDNE